METRELRYEDFLYAVAPAYHAFVNGVNGKLLGCGGKMKMELSKSGYVVSYLLGKRTVINFVFRKSGVYMRIYGDHIQQYVDELQTMPESMQRIVEKSPPCKRLLNPTACNAKCIMGYDFMLQNKHHVKCRYNCFLFPVNEESIPFLQTFVENELRCRAG